jgi:alanyl-tRNA synthetase
MKADILREKFLDYFKSKKHKIVEPDSLVPRDDPTVLFTPAGMNQFKKEFLGFYSGFKRAATCQRCLRTDDLDKVGKTPGHHTFFEMLGNFSFGDYFKKEAIVYAWEFLTEALKIDKERFWISIYKDDAQAHKIWRDLIKIPEYKIIKLGDKENFWPSEAKEKGPNGPCGPCSEIFFDWGANVGCKKPDCSPSCDCARFVEVWNLVFTQFNRRNGGILEPLPKKNIDTGMGLERLASIMQGVQSNFETELFKPIIKEIINYGATNKRTNGLIYAVADHIRAITFAIYDGVLPSNEGRGYVVRKLIRKSIIHLRGIGIKQQFLYRLVPVVTGIMQGYYPSIQERKENISEIILAEEKNFILTLNSSDILFKERFQEFLHKQDAEEVGKVAFQFYDTYGVPLELTRNWLEKHNIEFSQESFEKELEVQKNRSKLKSEMKGDIFDAERLIQGVKETGFLGYQDYSVKSKIIKIIKDNVSAEKINKTDTATIILEGTVFYPESGGQIGDSGELLKGKSIFEVRDTKKIGSVIIHIGRVKEGSFKKKDSVLSRINIERRLSIARNHTATHLLQAALRKVLGAHIKQQGSLVAEERLRFDFSHFKDVGKNQLDRIEEIVNAWIINNYAVSTKQKSLKEARKSGALAFFAEKYAQRVRVVSINGISKEICGGTHLNSTGQIGLFKITQECSIASGIRRIEAVTATFAYKRIKEQESIIIDASGLLNVPLDKIPQEIEKRNIRVKELERELNAQRLEALKTSLDTLIQRAEIINNIRVITEIGQNLDMDSLRKKVDLIKERIKSSVIALGSNNDGQGLLVMGITGDLSDKRLDAGTLIRELAGFIGGSGGGRKDFAQAGGNRPENFSQAFDRLKEIIRNLV